MNTLLPPRRIVILGGGTAGWMAANLIAHRWGNSGVTVTLVESPEIGIIGVGEGSTPQLKHFFDTLGIAESQWMPACNATYKHGIKFNHWSDRPGYQSYFHPFSTMIDSYTQPQFCYNTRALRTGRDVWAHPDRFFLPSVLAAKRLGPIPAECFPFNTSYGYHFDAHLVGAFLRNHAKSLGVVHLEHKITHIVVSEHGTIQHLVAESGDHIEGDLFVDSSGFRSAIAQEALGEPFFSYSDALFNDSAVVMPTPTDSTGTNAHTTATALQAGWAWDIPLTNRTGNGYVYASSFISSDDAETELRAHLNQLDGHVGVRHLKMKVGRLRRSWVKNVLAVGLAQGFIEPLEATALHIVQTTVSSFMDSWETGSRDHFNDQIAARYDGIRDYIVCHYKVNQRKDTDYWRQNSANQNLSDSLKATLTCWFKGQDLAEEISRQNIGHFYASLSWHCLLAGYGTFPDSAKISAPGPDIEHFDMQKIDSFLRRCAMNFIDHKELLESFGQRRMP